MAIVEYPRPSLLQRLLQRVGVAADGGTTQTLSALAKVIGPAFLPPIAPALLHLKPGEPWALLPFELELR